jgi:hypothetical protein
MKKYTLPAIVVLLASALLIFGMLQSFGRTQRSAADLMAAQSEITLAQQQLNSVQRRAAAAKGSSAQAEQFLATWTAEQNNESNIELVFGRLDTLAVNDLLSPSGKNFTLNKNYFFNGRHLPVQNVNITVAGDFPRTLNWLGAAESAFPLARVEQISYTTNANSLALAVQFVFPQKFDSE